MSGPWEGSPPVQNVCANCKRPWQINHVATSANGGPWHHSDCDDPTLEKTLPGPPPTIDRPW